MGSNVEINELLCYVQNYFGKHPKANMSNVLVGFYDEHEICAAKLFLFEFTDRLSDKPENSKRFIKRQGDNKKRNDCNDLLELYMTLDAAKVTFPKFVAANLSRLPSISPGEVDVYTIAQTVTTMQKQLENITRRITEMPVNLGYNLNESMTSASADTPILEGTAASETILPVHKSWACIAASGAVTPDGKPLINLHTVKPQQPKIKGMRKVMDKELAAVKAVPRKKIAAVHVSRMESSTTEDEFKSYLEERGLKDVVCKKIKGKDGKTFLTAAFYVSCCIECADILLDPEIWPCGAEIRDWIFKQ